MSWRSSRYSDVEEGLRTTVGFYLDALDALARKQALAVHVQPVAPVLNETREVWRPLRWLPRRRYCGEPEAKRV